MIELLSKTDSSKIVEKNHHAVLKKSDKSFRDIYNDTMKDKKNIKIHKIDNKQMVEEFNKQIKELEESEIIDENKRSSLQELVNFLKKEYLKLDDLSNDDIDPIIDSFLTTVQNFIHDTLNKYQAHELDGVSSFMVEKLNFIFEGMTDLSEFSMKPINKQILMNLESELKEFSDNLLEKIKMNMDEFSENEEHKLERKDILNEKHISKNENNKENKPLEFDNKNENSDTNKDFKSNIVMKDLRNNKKDNTAQTLFTLENIDKKTLKNNEGTNNSIISTIEIAGNKSDSLTTAQKAYNIVSSSVTRIQVEALMQNLAAKTAIILHDGGSELRMKLTPPELGQMKLSFMIEDSLMRGKIIVETPEAKMFFEQNIDNLRESLAQSGVTLGGVDVELSNGQEFVAQEDREGNFKVMRMHHEEPLLLEKQKLSDSLVDFIA